MTTPFLSLLDGARSWSVGGRKGGREGGREGATKVISCAMQQESSGHKKYVPAVVGRNRGLERDVPTELRSPPVGNPCFIQVENSALEQKGELYFRMRIKRKKKGSFSEVESGKKNFVQTIEAVTQFTHTHTHEGGEKGMEQFCSVDSKELLFSFPPFSLPKKFLPTFSASRVPPLPSSQLSYTAEEKRNL